MADFYSGTVIGQSLTDPAVVEEFEVVGKDLSPELGWDIYKIRASKEQIEKLSTVLKPGKWYMHFWQGDDVIVVFKDKMFELKHGDKTTWKEAVKHGLSMGIPKEQLDFPIDRDS